MGDGEVGIFDLLDCRIVSLEALARFWTEPMRSPSAWFAEATEVGLGVEFELAAIRAALLRLLTHDPPAHYEEIGKVMGIPIGSIGPSRARCLARLRRMPALAALGTAVSRLDAEPATAGDGPSGGTDG